MVRCHLCYVRPIQYTVDIGVTAATLVLEQDLRLVKSLQATRLIMPHYLCSEVGLMPAFMHTLEP